MIKKLLLVVIFGIFLLGKPAFAKSFIYNEKTLEIEAVADRQDLPNDKIEQVTEWIHQSLADNKSKEHISVLLSLRAGLYQQEKEYAKSLKDYNEALKYCPNEIKILEPLMNLQIKIQDYDGALLNANKIIILEPNIARHYMNRAHIYFELTQYQNAINDYTKAIVLQPKNPEAFELRGYNEILKGNKDKGFIDLKYAKQQYYELEMYDKYQQISKSINELKSIKNNDSFTYSNISIPVTSNLDDEQNKINQTLEDINRQLLFRFTNDTQFVKIIP